MGWEAVGFSEIEPFPCSVLAHHYPKVTNYGDMTKYKEWAVEPETVDLVCGGTPCQSFSVAGLRKGLDDPRGNLALIFLGIVDRFQPRWVVWENVPGVLSDRGNAFGQFVKGLFELGYGVCWRVLDAQYFGVPQRRRRVWVVGYLGDWRPSAAVLFERESLCRDLTPRREKRERVAGTIKGGSGDRGWSDPSDGNGGGMIEVADICPTIGCEMSKQVTNQMLNSASAFFIPQQVQWTSGGGKILNDTAQALRSGAEHNYQFVAEPIAIQNTAERLNPESGSNGKGFKDDGTMFTLDTSSVPHSMLVEMRVRRFTPRECERLQGFPDDYEKNQPESPRL